ncbi:DMT family transporter [Micromonospora sp. NPDC020750]|uniref:DMT family transporter n=1 Tax=unclassified Micromonospora TaxID=2617518 RepID=UPI0037BDB532
MAWIRLLGAIAFEVTGTSALKHGAGFTKLVPTIVVGVAYLLCFTLLALAVRHLQVNVAYAIRSGLGTAAIAVVARLAFGEALTRAKVAGIALIIAGAATLNLTGAE